MSNKSIVVVGSGPGIGVASAALFASKGFNVALLSRNADRLKDDASKVNSAATGVAKAHIYPVDVGDHAALKKALDQVHQDLGKPQVVLFNAARVSESAIGEEKPESVIADFQVMSVGLYVTAAWALPLLSDQSSSKDHPCFFVTGGQIWQYALPTHFSLSMNKAAQINFTDSFRAVAGPKGIHVATVSIGGAVKDEDPVMNAKNIADQYWELYQEEQSNWRSLVDVGDIRDLFGIKH